MRKTRPVATKLSSGAPTGPEKSPWATPRPSGGDGRRRQTIGLRMVLGRLWPGAPVSHARGRGSWRSSRGPSSACRDGSVGWLGRMGEGSSTGFRLRSQASYSRRRVGPASLQTVFFPSCHLRERSAAAPRIWCHVARIPTLMPRRPTIGFPGVPDCPCRATPAVLGHFSGGASSTAVSRSPQWGGPSGASQRSRFALAAPRRPKRQATNRQATSRQATSRQEWGRSRTFRRDQSGELR